MSKGTNNLLAEGATPLTNPADVLKIFQMNARPVNTAQTAAQPDPEAKRILSLLGTDSMHIDELCQRLDISIDKLTAQLALMELEGLVQRTHGMEYQAVKSWDAGRI
jgi:predicted Rossmann fold nucleotide-binding protein DprA/Smf involved in DNA uptake